MTAPRSAVYTASDLSLWNLTPHGPAVADAQRLFNVVGRLADPKASLSYRLNGGPRRPVYVNAGPGPEKRLTGPGAFNIDTIDRDELQAENLLELFVDGPGGTARHAVPFRLAHRPEGEASFSLDAAGAAAPEAVAQVVDGRWRLGEADGRQCLEIAPEDAGYDRLILFGRDDLSAGYAVDAVLEVTEWTNVRYHNVGLLFHWNPHRRGDGRLLPWQWTTGLAYYAAQSPGLRLRYGIDVHRDAAGRKVGCHVLAERPYDRTRRVLGHLRNDLIRVGRRPLTQLRTGVPYRFGLRVEPGRLTLAVHPADEPPPEPQLEARVAPLLPSGAPGVIAAHCGVRIHRFDVTPFTESTTNVDRPRRYLHNEADELAPA